jgi:hypothetical protein
MAHRSFVAFASRDSVLADAIARACEDASRNSVELVSWNMNDASGQPLGSTVYSWVEDADSIVADISEPNHNVTYEVGLAIGMAKPLRLIRAESKDWSKVQEIGLLHNIGHDPYSNQATLKSILERGPPTTAPWRHSRKKRETPIYFLQPSTANAINSRVASGIKKIIRKKFRSFKPWEIDRLTASEAFSEVTASFGVIATWHGDDEPESFRQNQRAAFAIGLARGLGLPFLLLAEEGYHLPLDLDDAASRYAKHTDVDGHLRGFKDGLEEFEEDFVEARELDDNLLDAVSCGDPTAENEAASLSDYFLQTEQYRLAYRGELNVILGRKGSGKSAIFLQVRDNVRVKKEGSSRF